MEGACELKEWRGEEGKNGVTAAMLPPCVCGKEREALDVFS